MPKKSLSLSVSEYARRRAVSTQAVRDAINTGRIHCEADGSISAARADADWALNTAPSARHIAHNRRIPSGIKAARTRTAEGSAVAEACDPEHLGSLSYIDARALKENFEAKLKHIELQKRMGNLLDRTVIENGVASACRICRDALLSIPSRISAQIVMMTEISDIQDAIAEEIRASLDELAAALNRVAEVSPK
jgi:hypothetical protein